MISKLQKNDSKNKGEFELVHKIIEGRVKRNDEREKWVAENSIGRCWERKKRNFN